MAKFFPVIGEIWTTAESSIKVIGAGIAKLAGDEKSAEELWRGAGQAWVEYSETNLVAAPVRTIVHATSGDEKEAKRVIGKFGNTAEGVVDNFPIVGHVKGVYHYLDGDVEHGDQCMKGASRSLVVTGVTVATGGLMAPVAGVAATAIAAGSASVGSGASMDLITTAIDSKVHDEFRPAGMVAVIETAVETGDKSALVDAILMPVGEFASGAMQGAAMKKAYKVNQIKNNRKLISDKIGTKATKDVVTTAREFDNAIKNYDIKGDNHVITKVTDKPTGEQFTGYNRRARAAMRTFNNLDEVSDLGGDNQSGLQSRTSNTLPTRLRGQRAHRSCAEQQAFNKYFDRFPEKTDGTNTQIISVKKSGDSFTTVPRCQKKCMTYSDVMSKPPTDCLPPTKIDIRSKPVNSYAANQYGAIALQNQEIEDDDNDEDHDEDTSDAVVKKMI